MNSQNIFFYLQYCTTQIYQNYICIDVYLIIRICKQEKKNHNKVKKKKSGPGKKKEKEKKRRVGETDAHLLLEM